MQLKICSLYCNNKYNRIKNSNPSFKMNLDCNIDDIGIDGNPDGVDARDFMRSRLLRNAALPTERIININATNIEEASLLNFKKWGDHSYSGENLMHHPECFKLLKNSGVNTVIDLIDKDGLEKTCNRYDINYYFYDAKTQYCGHEIFNNADSKLHMKKLELSKQGLTKAEFDNAYANYEKEIELEKINAIKKIKQFIDIVNNGGFYISCEYGEYRTLNCLALATILNENWKEKVTPNLTYIPKFKQFYNLLTDEHKQILGISKSYDKCLNNIVSNLKL